MSNVANLTTQTKPPNDPTLIKNGTDQELWSWWNYEGAYDFLVSLAIKLEIEKRSHQWVKAKYT